MTRNHSKEYKLDIEGRNRAILMAGQTERLLNRPVVLNYKLEMLRDLRNANA